MPWDLVLLALLVFPVAALYAAVGHGGASGYLALMALFAFDPGRMASTALALNLLVAGTGTLNFWKAGHLKARLFWPFAVASVPAAFLGGALNVPIRTYALLLAGVLLFAAARLLLPVSARAAAARGPTGATPSSSRDEVVRAPPVAVALVTGAAIGLLSGIVGVGGGIFLSPLMLLLGWAGPKQTAAASAAFILVNSVAGILGRVSRGAFVTDALLPLALSAFAGGVLGSYLGAQLLPGLWLRRLLGVVLLVATVKLLQTALGG